MTSFTPFLRRKSHGRLTLPADDLSTLAQFKALFTLAENEMQRCEGVWREETPLLRHGI